MNKHMLFTLVCSAASLQCSEQEKILSFYTDKSLEHPIINQAQKTIVSFMSSTLPASKNMFSPEFIQKEYPSEAELSKQFKIIQGERTLMDLKTILITQPLIKYVPNSLHQLLYIKFMEEVEHLEQNNNLFIEEIMATLVYAQRI